MSFDIFITCFQDGEAHPFPRKILEDAFGGFTDRSDPTSWLVSDSNAVIQVDDADEMEGFGVNRPPDGKHPFWPALVAVLRQTGSALYWPGGGPVVTDQAVVAQLPPEMIEGMGPPIVTTSVSEILRLIEES